MPARTNALRFFLTYSQVLWDLDATSIFDHLKTLPKYHWAEAAKEQHQDGGDHYHVVVVFKERLQKPLSIFDVNGYHPNILTIRNGGKDLYHRRHYIRKGPEDPHDPGHPNGPCTYSYEPFTDGPVPEYTQTATVLSWGGILDTATTKEDFLQLVRENKPGDFVLRQDNIQTFAQDYFNSASNYVPRYPVESYIVPREAHEWVQNVLRQNVDRPLTLCLIGKTRLGKTDWARSLGRHIYMCTMFNLDKWDDEAEYLVLDDIPFQYIGGFRKGLWGSQKELTLTDKYRKKRSVKWNKPLIFIGNESDDPRNGLCMDMGHHKDRAMFVDYKEKEWYLDNCTVVEIKERMY